jgi:F0F1-type ATP synthase assembly protein I
MGGSLANTIAAAALLGALAAWAMALVAFAGVWRHRGTAPARRLALSFAASVRDLPAEARPYLARLATAGAAFFVCILVGLGAGFLSPR